MRWMARVRSVNGMVGVAVAIMMVLAACTSMTGKTLGENIDDAGITSQVKAKLAGEKISTVTRIDVDTNQGIVALNGTVMSDGDAGPGLGGRARGQGRPPGREQPASAGELTGTARSRTRKRVP